MTPPTRGEFAALLADLDAAAYAGFLAALWCARGDDARVEDGRVVVAGGPTLHPHAPAGWLPARVAARRTPPLPAVEGADSGGHAVATTDPDVAALLRERGVPVVGPDRVRRALLYGLDRATADALCRDHLGRPLDADPPRGVGERVAAAVPEPAALALAGVVLLSVALVVPFGPLGTATPGDPAPADVATPGGDAGEAGGDGESPDLPYPPGVDAGGVDDAVDLRRAHEAAVAGRSYTWRLTYREYSLDGDRSLATTRTRTVRVENRTTFHETTTGSGEISTPSIRVDRREVHADGRTRYVRRAAANRTAAAGNETDGTAAAISVPTTATATPTGNGTATTATATPSTTPAPTTATATPSTTTPAPTTVTVTRDATLVDDDATAYAETAGRYIRWFASGNRDETRTVTRNGTTLFQVTIRGIPYPGFEDYRVLALVDRSGFVRQFRVEYTRPVENVAVVITFRYDRVGATTVNPPVWYERATRGENASTTPTP